MIACASRPSEALGARWSEINFEERLWTIPAKRMKSGKAHVVPLSSLGLAILDRRMKLRVDDAIRLPGKAGQIATPTLRAPPRRWRSMTSGHRIAGDRFFATGAPTSAASASNWPNWRWRIASARWSRRIGARLGFEPRRKVMQDYADWITSVDGVTALETASRAAA